MACHQYLAISREILFTRLSITLDTGTGVWSKSNAFLHLLEEPHSSFRLPSNSLDLTIHFTEALSDHDHEAARRRRRVRDVLAYTQPRIHKLGYGSKVDYQDVKQDLEEIQALGIHLAHTQDLAIVVRSQTDAAMWMKQIGLYAMKLETLEMTGLPSALIPVNSSHELPTQSAPSSLKELSFNSDVISSATELLDWLWRSDVFVQRLSVYPRLLGNQSIARTAEALRHPVTLQSLGYKPSTLTTLVARAYLI